MDKLKNYEFLAKLEVEQKAMLIPEPAASREGILQVLGITADVVNELDKSLAALSEEYIAQNAITADQAVSIHLINAKSLYSLLSKAFVNENGTTHNSTSS